MRRPSQKVQLYIIDTSLRDSVERKPSYDECVPSFFSSIDSLY